MRQTEAKPVAGRVISSVISRHISMGREILVCTPSHLFDSKR